MNNIKQQIYTVQPSSAIPMKPSNSKYVVAWEKWIDPFKLFIKKDSKLRSRNNIDIEDIDNDFEDVGQYSGPVAITDFGLLPISEKNIPSTYFNFWIGHTNFILNSHHKYILDMQVKGIESLTIYSSYRFRICIAKLFNQQDVLKRTESSLINYMESLDAAKLQSATDNWKSSLSKQYKFFAIASVNNQKKLFHGDTEIEVSEQIDKFKENPANISANILYSWK